MDWIIEPGQNLAQFFDDAIAELRAGKARPFRAFLDFCNDKEKALAEQAKQKAGVSDEEFKAWEKIYYDHYTGPISS